MFSMLDSGAWEAIIVALITAVSAVVVAYVSRTQATKTRKAGAEQHTEQNTKLDYIVQKLDKLETKVDENKVVAEKGIADLHAKVSDLDGKVSGSISATETLFSMIVDLDRKVTSRNNSVSPGNSRPYTEVKR